MRSREPTESAPQKLTSSPFAVGGVDVLSVVDAWGTLGPLAQLFPGVAREAWAPYRAAYPALFGPGYSWRLPFGCFVVRGLGRTILVDAGVGRRSRDFALDRRARLPDALAGLGIAPDSVDTVFLTHLHSDHIGWIRGDGAKVFANARHLTHRAGWEWTCRRPQSLARDALARLAGAGRLDLLDGDVVELVPGIHALATPGHAPGHMSVRVQSDDARLLILGDVAVHPAQLEHPDWEYCYDEDRAAAVATRRQLLPDLLEPGTLVACGHYPGAIGHVARTAAGVEWHEAAPPDR